MESRTSSTLWTWAIPLDSNGWRWVPREWTPGATGWWRNDNTEHLEFFPPETSNQESSS